MKKIDNLILIVFATSLAILSQSLPTKVARAAGRDDGGGTAVANGGAELEIGTAVRYRVGYMKSRAGSAPRSATVVTVVNEANVSCTISVDWRLGFSETGPGGVICTTTFANLARGQSVEFCTRAVPEGIATCNSVCSPELTFEEGNAVIGSTTGTACGKLTVGARTFYFGATDAELTAISDSAVTKFGVGTVGN